MTLDQAKLQKNKKNILNLREKLDIASLEKKRVKLEKESADPNLWRNEDQAKKVLQELSQIQDIFNEITSLEEDLTDLSEIVSLNNQNKKDNLNQEIEKLYQKFLKKLKKIELKTYLSGSYDHQGAILSIHSGQGGTEAMDWAAMLFRMYTRYLEAKEWSWKLINESPGEEAGIKSATVLISTPNAYGFLKREAGVHRLVRLSPFNADNLRQTSFAAVEVIPIMDEKEDVDIKSEDLEINFFRSSGPGGQNVNKLSTAVRLKHKPTNIIVECQTQRYQEQNRKLALKLLRAKLWEREEKERQKEISKVKGKHQTPGWGRQIRSYVLHPYKQVKDLRTQAESADPNSVLDGKLDQFIEAELKAKDSLF